MNKAATLALFSYLNAVLMNIDHNPSQYAGRNDIQQQSRTQ
jgi:hypothetical protein